MTEELYKGRKIVWRLEGNLPSLQIDGVSVPVTPLANGRFSSVRFPYATFPSLADLGKSLIDAGLL